MFEILKDRAGARTTVWSVIGGVALAVLLWLGVVTKSAAEFQFSLRDRVPAIEKRVDKLELAQSEKFDKILERLDALKEKK